MRVALSQSTVAVRMVAPVVKITDTAVADSDDSMEDRYRFRQRALILDGDVIVPLDGSIEDNAMDGRNLGDQTIDSSTDELESSQQIQDRMEQNFQIGSKIVDATDGTVDSSQVRKRQFFCFFFNCCIFE